MKLLSKRHRFLALLILTALLFSLLPGGSGQPPIVRAATEASLDPSEEIVYIDGAGVIRVLDTKLTGSNPEVKWVSPVSGFRDVALGDVNNDGDQEIIGLSGGSIDGKLVVYDPVVASGLVSDPNQKINGIPWDTLYVTDTLGSPQLVETGNFDINVPGDEIIYIYEIRPGDKEKPEDSQRMVILKGNSQTPNGRGWLRHLTAKYEENWETIAVGNLVGDSSTTPAEFVLSSEDNRLLNAFQIDGGLKRIYDYGSDSKPPKTVAIGHWEDGGREEMAFVRDKATPLASLFVVRNTSSSSFEEIYTEPFEPSPRVSFFANINSNKDEELVLLRTVDPKLTQARMIVRGRGNKDIPAELEQRLDSDNGYRAGAGGDVDGDGKDEIVLMRDNKILVFIEAERSGRTDSYNLPTNRRNIVIGDLDANGFIPPGPQFAVSRTEVQGTVEAGGPTKQETVNLTNATAAATGEVPFTVSVDGNPPWLTITTNNATTPATLTFNFNANGVGSGDYTANVRIDSPSNVVNKPLLIKASVKVTAALFAIDPGSVAFSYDCATSGPISTKSIGINGTAGVRYSAAILNPATLQAATAALNGGEIYNGYLADDGSLVLRDGSDQESVVAANNLVAASALEAPSEVTWLKATPVTGTIPSNITLSASPLISSTTKFAEALLVVIADSRAGAPPGNVRVANISIVCAASNAYLPTVLR